MIIRDACTHPWFVMKETWSRAETLSVPMKRVPDTMYSCVKRKMRAEGREPARAYSRNRRVITSIAASGVRIICDKCCLLLLGLLISYILNLAA